jgi:hypothetical protein
MPAIEPSVKSTPARPDAGAGASRSLFGRIKQAGWLLALLCSAAPALAYPPTPHHVVYGLLRDAYGEPLMNSQAKLLLVTADGARRQVDLQPSLAVGINYAFRVPMDSFLRSDVYRSGVASPGAAFTIYVILNGVTNLPMVVSGSTAGLGQPGKMTRIDLALGVDANQDGLPDAWELALLASLGSNLKLSDLNANSRITPDGLTLAQRFLQSGDTSGSSGDFSTRLVNVNGGQPLLEFAAVAGQTYSVSGSTDLQHWTAVTFRLSTDAVSVPARSSYLAPAAATLRVQALPPGPVAEAMFFRIGRQ